MTDRDKTLEVMASAICVNRAPCEACRLSAERALTALEASGMAVVPREPTEAMLEAGATGSGEDSKDVAHGAWAAMLAASPYGKAGKEEDA